MPKSREAYVDTSAFIAFMDASDRHHPLFARLFADPPPLVALTGAPASTRVTTWPHLARNSASLSRLVGTPAALLLSTGAAPVRACSTAVVGCVPLAACGTKLAAFL